MLVSFLYVIWRLTNICVNHYCDNKGLLLNFKKFESWWNILCKGISNFLFVCERLLSALVYSNIIAQSWNFFSIILPIVFSFLIVYNLIERVILTLFSIFCRFWVENLFRSTNCNEPTKMWDALKREMRYNSLIRC